VSIRMMTRVWDARGITSSSTRLVLLKLADCANDAGERAFPSVQTMADECEVNRATVQRALRWLVAEGWITQVNPARHHRPAEWRILIDAAGQRVVPGLVQGPQDAAPDADAQGPHPVPVGAALTTRRGRKHDAAHYVLGTVKEPSVPVTAAVAVVAGPGHPIKALLTEHERLFRLHIGQVPHYTGKDAKLAGALIAQHGYDAVVAMLPALFTSTDPFVRQSGHDMAILSSCWNKLLVQAAPAVQMTETTSKTMTAGARWLAKQQEAGHAIE